MEDARDPYVCMCLCISQHFSALFARLTHSHAHFCKLEMRMKGTRRTWRRVEGRAIRKQNALTHNARIKSPFTKSFSPLYAVYVCLYVQRSGYKLNNETHIATYRRRTQSFVYFHTFRFLSSSSFPCNVNVVLQLLFPLRIVVSVYGFVGVWVCRLRECLRM